MELKDWCHLVYSKATDDESDFPREYHSIAKPICQAVALYKGIKTSLNCNLTEEQLNQLRISLVLSDFTSVIASSDGQSRMTVVIEEGRSEFSPSFYLVTEEFFNLHLKESKAIGAGYIYPAEEKARQFLQEIKPLAEAGRVLFRPQPVAAAFIPMPNSIKSIKKQEGDLLAVLHPVETNLSGEGWYIVGGKAEQTVIPLKPGEAQPDLEKTLATILVPYIEGLSFFQLAEILEDEEYNLAELRSSIKKMLYEVKQETNRVIDIVNDIIRPSIDRIERRFKSITNIHRIKLAGAIASTATLGLVAYTGNGLITSVASMLGAGGLGLIAKEQSEFLKEKSDLKEMPFYLIWRLVHARQKS